MLTCEYLITGVTIRRVANQKQMFFEGNCYARTHGIAAFRP